MSTPPKPPSPDGEGVEPSRPFRARRFSRPVPSPTIGLTVHTPGRTRTYDLRFRRALLLSTELLALEICCSLRPAGAGLVLSSGGRRAPHGRPQPLNLLCLHLRRPWIPAWPHGPRHPVRISHPGCNAGPGHSRRGLCRRTRRDSSARSCDTMDILFQAFSTSSLLSLLTAQGRSRTCTSRRTREFESRAAANYATRASAGDRLRTCTLQGAGGFRPPSSANSVTPAGTTNRLFSSRPSLPPCPRARTRSPG